MKKLYILCFLTLLALILDITLFHSNTVVAQEPLAGSTVRVERVRFNGTRGDVPISGRVVGFQCIDTPGGPQCFVASGWVSGLNHSQ